MRETNSVKGKPARAVADRKFIPDYSRLRPCDVDASELLVYGVTDVHGLVDLVNGELVANGHFPVTQSDYPTTRKRLAKLIERWERTCRGRKAHAA